METENPGKMGWSCTEYSNHIKDGTTANVGKWVAKHKYKRKKRIRMETKRQRQRKYDSPIRNIMKYVCVKK